MIGTVSARNLVLAFAAATLCSQAAAATVTNAEVDRVVGRGLEWLASHQSRVGHWTAGSEQYPTAMTALAGIAMLCEGSTTLQGKYAANIRRAVDYLVSRSRRNGLIGDPHNDSRYTYGHGFAMLFLSQVLGEEEDAERREKLIEVLSKGVEFTGRAQTPGGGWGYVSSKDGGGFDEGSTTITQVQALRGCRNAGIPVPKEIIDKAVGYIKKCTEPDGGVRYQLAGIGGGGRPPITAAAVACLFNAGDYNSSYVPKLLRYCKKNLGDGSEQALPAIGIMPTTTTPKSCIAKAVRVGRRIATKSIRGLCPRPAATVRGTKATSARSSRRPSI